MDQPEVQTAAADAAGPSGSGQQVAGVSSADDKRPTRQSAVRGAERLGQLYGAGKRTRTGALVQSTSMPALSAVSSQASSLDKPPKKKKSGAARRREKARAEDATPDVAPVQPEPAIVAVPVPPVVAAPVPAAGVPNFDIASFDLEAMVGNLSVDELHQLAAIVRFTGRRARARF